MMPVSPGSLDVKIKVITDAHNEARTELLVTQGEYCTQYNHNTS